MTLVDPFCHLQLELFPEANGIIPVSGVVHSPLLQILMAVVSQQLQGNSLHFQIVDNALQSAPYIYGSMSIGMNTNVVFQIHSY